MKKKFAVFVSGSGTNLQEIINKTKQGYIKADLSIVISDNPKAYALIRAKKAGIKCRVYNLKDYVLKTKFEADILKELKKEKIDFIVLAGFMRILSAGFVNKYKNKILNIHPALLPAFKGACAIKDAFNAKVAKTGVTVHLVTEKVDSGPIIAQKDVFIKKGDTLIDLTEKIHEAEHEIYPKIIKLFSEGKIKV